MSVWDSTLKQHKARQRDHIIDTAVALLGEHGVSGVSMSGLAKQAGVSRQTLYNYFPDFNTILAAYSRREMERNEAELQARLAAIEDPAERLEAFVRASIESLAHQIHTIGWDTPLAPTTGDHAASHMHHVGRLVAEILADGVQAGAFRKEANESDFPIVLFQLVASFQPLVADGADIDKLADRCVDFVRRIVAP